MVQNIECEIKIFLTDEEYQRLHQFFNTQAHTTGEDFQITYYFKTNVDLRIQQNSTHSKIILKKGIVHDESREELEISFTREDFPFLEKLFLALGYTIGIQWFRKRFTFTWNDVEVALDDTKGYGKILELEKKSTAEDTERTVSYLKSKLQELNLALTPREEFERRFMYYKEHWRELV